MASTNLARRSWSRWQKDLAALAVLAALGGLIPVILSSCTYGCSSHTSKTSYHPQKLLIQDSGPGAGFAPGQPVGRELLMTGFVGQDGPSTVEVEWTPPDGASELTFLSHPADNPDGPAPFRFSAVPVGSLEDPVRLQVRYVAPAKVLTAVNDTFRVLDPDTGETVHVSSLTSPGVGVELLRRSMPRGRTLAEDELPRASKVGASARAAWVSQQWIYAHDPQEFDETMCRQVFDAVASGNLFVAVHFPRRTVGSGVPVVLSDGVEPRVSLIDYTAPSDQREALSFDLELAPERMSWIAANMAATSGYDWTALRPNLATVPACPAGISIGAGMWEFYSETLIDYADDPGECSGCTLEHHVCWEGQDPPVQGLVSSAGRSGGLKSVQADGVTCFGPSAVRLHDMSSPPDPAFMLAAGEIAFVEQPPERVIFHSWLTNNSQTSYSVNLSAESSQGIQWRFFSNETATASLSQPLSLPASSGREVWIAADIPAGASGVESVRIVATATSAPGNPVWGTNIVHIGDWVPPPGGEPESARVWVPVASRAAGVGGSQWRTDVGLLNPGSANATAQLRLYAGGTTHEIQRTVAAGQQRILGDVVGLFGVDGSGALEIEADQNLIATSRTYSLLAATDPCYPSGTFGQFLAGVGSSAGLRSGQTGWLPQLAENASYRTNLAVTNTGDQPATVTVILHDAAGAEITRFDLELTPGQWRQENRVFFRRGGRADLDAASAEIQVTTGSGILAYASVVDNVTTDPTTIPLVTGGGATTTWVPVASRAAGVGGSQWRTDLGLLNAGAVRANVTVRFHSGGSSSQIQVMVAPGLQRIMEDVVERFATSGSGAVEVISTLPVIVTSRTYSLLGAADPCSPGGTFGQFLAGQPSSEGLSAGDSGRLPQLRENAAYRTNLALTNTGATTATATVVLLDAAGVEITRFEVSLEPGEWKQENRVFFRRGGRENLGAASARIEVTAGSGVLAYASVVDNVTSDPTTIPLQQ